MATVGTLNRRLDRVEAKAAELDGQNGDVFEVYALLFVQRLGTEEAKQAIYEVLFYPNETPSLEARQMVDAARKQAREAIKAAGETTITAALFEEEEFRFSTHGATPENLAWWEARRDKTKPLAKMVLCTRSTLMCWVRISDDLWAHL